MAFGNIATFYVPTPANAGSSLWGTDVRKLLSAADAASGNTTITDHGTGGAVTRTEDPYSTSTADSDQTLFGWAIQPSDMNSVSGAKRFFPAGNHTVTVRMAHSGATAATGTLFMYVYRVGPAAGRTRTQLGTNSASVSFPAVSGEVTATVTVALPEIIFDVDETVQYSFELSLAGVAVTGHTATFFAGTQSAVATRIDTPTLRVLADTAGTASGTGAASGVFRTFGATVGSSTGVGAASGAGAARSATTGAVTAAATVTGVGGARAGYTGTVTAAATASGVTGAIGSMAGTAAGVGAASAVTGKVLNTVGASTGSVVVAGAASSTATTTGTTVGTGAASGLMSSLSGTVGNAAGAATVTGRGGVVIGTVGTVDIGGPGGGGSTVIKKVMVLFDD